MKSYLTYLASIIISISLISTAANAATNVPQGPLNSAHWTLAGSPYKVQGNIEVRNNDTLIIDPGVVVEFQGKYRIACKGTIIANGTAAQRIVFTVPVIDRSKGWQGIRYDKTLATNGQSSFKYCVFEYGRALAQGETEGGAFYFKEFSKCTISNSVIRNCSASSSGGGIAAIDASPTITQDSFYNNYSFILGRSINLTVSSSVIDGCYFKDGGVFCSLSDVKITNNTFYKCLYRGGLYIVSNPSTGLVEISNNTFDSCFRVSGAGGGAILLVDAAKAKVEHNVFKNNVSESAGGAISCYTIATSSSTGDVIISNNLFYNNKSQVDMTAEAPMGGGAIYFSKCVGRVLNNTIISNTSGTTGAAIYCTNGSSPIFHNNIIYGNGQPTPGDNIFIQDNNSNPGFYYNNIEGGYAAINTNGMIHTGANVNNINVAPNFTDPSSEDYTLKVSSKCINAGVTVGVSSFVPALDLAGKTRVTNGQIDLGAYEYKDTTTSIAELANSEIVKLYPNPVKERFSISEELLDDVISIEVYDVFGKKVAHFDNVSSNRFDVSRLSNGMYLVQLLTKDNGVAAGRLLKE